MFGSAAIFSTFFQGVLDDYLKPKIFDFRVEDAFPSRIYFNSSEPITMIDATGFDYTFANLTSVTIITSANTGHYFETDAPLTFWSQGERIDYDGTGNLKDSNDNNSYGFSLRHVVNNINEPSRNGVIHYVKLSGNDTTGDGSEGNPYRTLTKGSSLAVAGDAIYAEKGAYGNDQLKFLAPGEIDNPIKFVGYGVTPNDHPTITRAIGMAFNGNDLPFISDNNIDVNEQSYIIIKNIMVQPNSSSVDSVDLDDANNVYMKNIYIEEGKNGFWTFKGNPIVNTSIISCFAQNQNNTQISISSDGHYIHDFFGCTSYVKDNDYYINVLGTMTGGGGVIKGCYVNRFDTDSHPGHGIALKCDENNTYGYILEKVLVEDCDIINVAQSLELKHHGTRFCVIRDVRVDWDGNDNNTYMGIHIQSASFNIIESCLFEAELGIRWGHTIEDSTADDAGNNNLFINDIWKNSYNLHKWWQYNANQSSGFTKGPNDNMFYHCLVEGVSQQLIYNENASGTISLGNTVINSILQNCGTRQSTGQTMEFIITYTNLFNSFIDLGTGNTTNDPQLSASFQPQASFASMQVPKLAVVDYSYHDKERMVNTTGGPVLHADEVFSEDVTAPAVVSMTIENATPDEIVVVFDEPITGTNLGWTIAGTTSATPDSFTGTNATWVLKLGTNAVFGETIDVTYNNGDVADLSSNLLANFSNYAVTNNVEQIPGPTLDTITIEDLLPAEVVMVFSEAVTGTNLGFTIGGTTSTAFDSISGSGTTTITGVLAADAVFGETITLSYSESTGDMIGALSNPLEDITNQAVTNNVADAVVSYGVENISDPVLSKNWISDITTGIHMNYSGSGGSLVVGSTSGYVQYAYTQTDPDDITTVVKGTDSNSWGNTTQGAFWNSDGSHMFSISNGTLIRSRAAGTNYNLASMTGLETWDISGDGIGETRGLEYKGGFVYILDQANDTLNRYTWDGVEGYVPDGLTLQESISIVANSGSNYQGVAVSPDGKTVLISRVGNDTVEEWVLPTPYILTGATYVQVTTLPDTCCGNVQFNTITYSLNGNAILLTASNVEMTYQLNLNNGL